MEEGLISGAEAYKKPIMSVGEEFMAWAESGWGLDEHLDGKVKNPSEKGGEYAPYSVIKPIFIDKINSLIRERVEHYM